MASSNPILVTTSHGAKQEIRNKAKHYASEHGLQYISRRKIGDLNTLSSKNCIYVFSQEKILSIVHKGGELFFHPSVAKIRMLNICKGQPDHLIDSLSLNRDSNVLDTTLGLGTEALLIAAFAQKGSVTALEQSEHISEVVRFGLREYRFRERWMADAASRIEVVNRSFKDYLQETPEKSFDVVYCDPMFERPKAKSSSINALRPFASHELPSENDIVQMIRVAARRVVFKVRKTDRLFHSLLSLGFSTRERSSSDILFLVAEST